MMRAHPYADKFPMLPDEELQELAESIRANGLRNPIVVTRDGLILDGRNRAKACEIAGVDPLVETYEGDDIAEYVIDCNTTRRHMSTGARAMASALVLLESGQRLKKEDGTRYWAYRSTIQGPGSSDSSWAKAIQRAGVVLDYAKDLADRVVSGELPLKTAFTEANDIKLTEEAELRDARRKAKEKENEKREEAERQAAMIADLTKAGATKYLNLIDQGTLDVPGAWGAWREDTRKEREHERQIWDGRRRSYEYISRAISAFRDGRIAANHWLEDPYLYDQKLADDDRVLITRERVTTAIEYLNTLLERINR